MSRQITLELPDELAERAERFAALSSRDLVQVLVEAVAASLPPLDAPDPDVRPVRELSDNAIEELVALQLTPAQDQRLTLLLDRQQAGALTAAQRAELVALMHGYEAALLRKSEALAEAVRRGLRSPLTP